MKTKNEKIWGVGGFVCTVVINPMGFRCGYVGLPKGHPLFGVPYGGLNLSVHGGLTFAGENTNGFPLSQDTMLPANYENGVAWFFGFDCGHYRDGVDLALMDDRNKMYYNPKLYDGPVRSLEYCIGECESLAWQLEDAAK